MDKEKTYGTADTILNHKKFYIHEKITICHKTNVVFMAAFRYEKNSLCLCVLRHYLIPGLREGGTVRKDERVSFWGIS